MASKSRVAVVTRESSTRTAVTSVIQSSEQLESAGTFSDLQELVGDLESNQVPLALVDIDPQPENMLRDLDTLTSRFRETRFIVLSTELRNDLVIEAMQAGARHFLTKSSVGDELDLILRRLTPANGSSHNGGRGIITVLSVSGGCGATTISVNLANEIQLQKAEPVLIVDLDAAYGAVASYLDVRGQYGIGDVLMSPGRIDAELIRSTSVSCGEKLSVLLSPASVSLANPLPLDYRVLEDTLKAFPSAYPYTVVDAPRVPIDAAGTLARASSLTLLVCQLTVKDLRMARAIWGALAAQGVESQRVVLIANRYRRWRSMVTLNEVRRSLPELTVETFRNDFRSSIRGLNYGQPLARVAPRSLLRRAIKRLATRLVTAPAGTV